VDGLEALHADELERARQDHHALAQLAQFNREDPTLVAAMIRVAVAGVNLQFSWQAQQHPGWRPSDLAAMQQDWEQLDLLAAVETGFTGERAFAELGFQEARRRGISPLRRRLTLGGSRTAPWDDFIASLQGFFWDADADELFALRHHQVTLDAIRALRSGHTWPEVDAALNQQAQVSLSTLTGSNLLNALRYQYSSLALANLSKATQTTVRTETLRRMAIVALALKRFQLRHGQFPAGLEALVPDYLTAVPLDLMDGRPLRYRRNGERGFVLYSVGEDGKDDGGSLVPNGGTAAIDPWSTQDTRWPGPED